MFDPFQLSRRHTVRGDFIPKTSKEHKTTKGTIPYNQLRPEAKKAVKSMKHTKPGTLYNVPAHSTYKVM